MSGANAEQNSSRWFGWWILVLLGSPLMWFGGTGAGIGVRPAMAALPAASAAPSSAPPALPSDSLMPSPECVQRFLSPFEAAAAEGPTAPVSGETWQARVEAVAAKWKRALASADGTGADVEVLIATVADPLDSGLTYEFETELGAIRSGIEAPRSSTKYFRDRSWLPWDDRDVSDGERLKSAACRKTTPGVLLFRNSSIETSRLLAVLVVGETPTSGVRGAAMMNALDIAAKLEGWWPSAFRRSVKIVGPTFSGSAYSLRASLHKWEIEHPKFPLDVQAVSGSASGSEVPSILSDAPSPSSSSSSISFQRTTVPEEAVSCAYFHFLTRHGVSANDSGALEGVATLQELGTEFGASGRADVVGSSKSGSKCRYRETVSLAFPVNVSFVRDAYDAADRRAQGQAGGIGRATSLSPTLQEPSAPIDGEGAPSDKRRAAIDLTLGSVLGEISRQRLRHVAIHATNIADAIFLARRIRDIAPDVRLAFFDADTLLTHEEYRRVLLGSLVVTPYPHLGVDEFRDFGAGRDYMGFENAAAEGVFNAARVQANPGISPKDLRDYIFDKEPRTLLPIWVTTVSRSGLVPMEVRPPVACDGSIFGTPHPNPAAGICNAKKDGERRAAYEKLNRLATASMPLQGESGPRLWSFLFMALLFVFCVDAWRQRAVAMRFDRVRMPETITNADDRDVDRAMGRTKWRLYSAIRTFVFALAFFYMGTINVLAMRSRAESLFALKGGWPNVYLFIIGSAFVASLGYTLARVFLFCRDYYDFARCVGVPFCWKDFVRERPSVTARESRPSRPPLSRRMLALVGVIEPVDAVLAARMSFKQLSWIVGFSGFLSVAFTVCLVLELRDSAAFVVSDHFYTAVPALTLTVLRSTPLVNGVSAAAPILLCMTCVYVWSVGRMSRLFLAHGASRMSPADAETDIVSTPIRLILHPTHEAGNDADEGLTNIERDVLNAIWRPITNPNYFYALCAICFFPALLFRLKPVSTLEGYWGTTLLGGGLGLAAFLIGVTLVQLVQYWRALELLLKRLMAHRIGPHFAKIAAFARDEVERQITYNPNEMLRWVACARLFPELVANNADPCLAERARDLKTAATHALAEQSSADAAKEAEYFLANRVIQAASDVTRLLEAAPAAAAKAAAGRPSEKPQAIPEAGDETARAEQHISDVSEIAGKELREETQLLAGGQSPRQAVRRLAAPPRSTRDATDAMPDIISASLPLTDAPPSAPSTRANPVLPRQPAWINSANAFVATVLTLLLHRHVRQFRYFFSTLTTVAVLLLLAVASYPFEPYRLLLSFIWVVVASVVGTGLWIYVRLEQNSVLSLISGTTPHEFKLTGPFLSRALTWGLIPLLGVAAAQYPDLASFLYRFIAPFASALK